jgi:hypothetical protein
MNYDIFFFLFGEKNFENDERDKGNLLKIMINERFA